MVLPLLAAAGVQAAGSLLSGMFQGDAADEAAKAQRRAIAEAQGYVTQGADARVAGLDERGRQIGRTAGDYRAGRQAYDRYARQADNLLAGGQSRALNYLDPYMSGGAGAQDQLLDALGVNGPEAQAAYYEAFQDDPGFAASLEAGTEAIDRSAAARGGLNSGGMAKDLYSFGQRQRLGAYQDRLNRLSALGTQGYSAAGQAAGIVGNTAASRANVRLGQGETARGTYNALAGVKLAQGDNAAQVGDVRGGMYDNYANLAGQLGNVNANRAIEQGDINAGMVQGVGNALGTALGAWRPGSTAGGPTYLRPQRTSSLYGTLY